MKRDYYEMLGVSRGRRAGGAQEGVPQARPPVPPGQEPRTIPRPRPSSRRPARPTRSSPTTRSARSTTASVTRRSAAGGGDPFGGLRSVRELRRPVRGVLRRRHLRRGGQRGRGRRGADLRYDLEVEFTVAALGGEQTLKIPKHKTCATCSGHGRRARAPARAAAAAARSRCSRASSGSRAPATAAAGSVRA